MFAPVYTNGLIRQNLQWQLANTTVTYEAFRRSKPEKTAAKYIWFSLFYGGLDEIIMNIDILYKHSSTQDERT